MASIIKSSNKTIHDALRVLARDIQSEDGAANVAIAEAADRISELDVENDRLHLQNAALKREIEEIKRVRYCVDDALTRPQAEAAAAWADKERLDWLDQKIVSSWLDGKDFVVWDKSSPQPCSIREWLDAARKESQS